MADLVEIGFVADASGVKKAQGELNKLAATGDKTDKSLTKSSKGMSTAFAAIGAAIGSTVAAALSLSKLVGVTREFDVLNAQLITATGSAMDAGNAFHALQQIASTTPYDLQQVTESFTKLVNLGLTPSQRALVSYGNTASAMGKDLNQLIEAVADAATGEFERLKEFGIKASKEGDNVSLTFRGVTTTIKNSSEEIEGYLMALGENEFAGAMATRMDSLDGDLSNLGDTIDGLFLTVSKAGIGEAIRDSVQFAIGALSELNAMIASGQLGGYLDAIAGKFSAFANDARAAFISVADGYDWLEKMLSPSGGTIVDFLLDAFRNLPENIRAFVQLAVIEIAVLSDKAMAYGEQIARSLNPVTAIQDALGGYAKLNENIERINSVRENSIATVLAERDAALESFEDQISNGDQLRATYDEAAGSVIDLGQFSKKAGEDAAEGIGKATKEGQKLLDMLDADEVAALLDWDGIDPFADLTDPAIQHALKEQQEEFDSLIESVDEFGGAWSRTGSAVIDAVGGIADALDDYSMRMEAIGKKEAELAIARKESMGDPAKIAAISAAEVKLSKERTRANISGYSQMAGAAASMFKEHSKGREAMNRAEKAFAAVEIALALQKASANALTAITSSFAAPFPVNFAAGAAMIAIMAGLGVFNGGGSGSAPSAEDIQAAQGTGTVMGGIDDKSESIINAFEGYEDIALDQLVELRGIRDALTGLSSGIALLARDFISGGNFSGAEVKGLGTTQAVSFGDFAGKEVYDFLNPFGADILNKGLKDLFGSTKKSLKDSGLLFNDQELGDILYGNFEAYFYNTIETTKKSLFGLSKKTSTNDELAGLDSGFEAQIQNIFGYIGAVVGGSLDVLGIDSAKAIEDFVINIGKVSFKDLSGEEIQAELEAIFSQQADLIAEFMIPQITQYQKMGEGAFETLTRVAKEQAIFNDSIDAMGLSLGELSSIMRIDVAQSIITMMGGLEEFSEKTSAYFEAFFTESEKFDMLSASLGEAFGSIGVALPETREGFRAIIEGLDLTTEADQRLFASLMELVPGLDQYIEALDKSAEAQANATEKAKAAANAAMKAADTDVYNSMISGLKDQKKLIDGNLSSAEAALKKAFDAEKKRLTQSDQEKIQMIDSAAAAEIESINSAHAAKMSALGESNAAEIASIEQRKSIASQMASDLRGLSDKLSSAAAAIGITVMSSAQAQDQLSVALRDARSGNFGAALNLDGAISALSGMDESGYSNAVDFAIAQGRAQYALTELAKLSGTRATTEEQLVILLESESVAAQARHEALIEAASTNNEYLALVVQNNADAQKQGIESQVEALDKQLNELLGIDTSVLSLSDAIEQYEETKKEADNFDYEAQIAILDNARDQLGELQRMNEQMKIANENMQAQLISIAQHTSESASIARREEFAQEAV